MIYRVRYGSVSLQNGVGRGGTQWVAEDCKTAGQSGIGSWPRWSRGWAESPQPPTF